MELIVTIAVAALGIWALIKILASPVKLIFKLALNACTGFLLLILANLISGFFDFSVPISLLNVLIAGCLGIPGTLLLVLLQLI